MTEIDVPDWVVEVAMQAENKFYAEKNYGSFSDIQGEDAAEAMRAVLNAALGAWVVPACYRLHQPNHSSEWISGVYCGPPFTHKAWSVEQTFTLRQEKPE